MSPLQLFLQQLLNGLTLGAVYALIALILYREKDSAEGAPKVQIRSISPTLGGRQ